MDAVNYGTGRIKACFDCLGTIPEETAIFIGQLSSAYTTSNGAGNE